MTLPGAMKTCSKCGKNIKNESYTILYGVNINAYNPSIYSAREKHFCGECFKSIEKEFNKKA